MTALFHSTTNARRPTLDARRSRIFTFGVQRSLSTSELPNVRTLELPRSAFTLVETALALLAISLGLLGIFGLARHGLKNGGDTENETRCTLLADTVFETLKAKNNALLAERYSLNEWQNFWTSFANNKTSYTTYFCSLPLMFDVTSLDTSLKIICGSAATPPIIHNLQEQLSESEKEPDKWNPQYILSFTSDSDTYFTVQLAIHPGQLQSGSEWRVYYTTLSYVGGLP